jgi:hypothetical protein
MLHATNMADYTYKISYGMLVKLAGRRGKGAVLAATKMVVKNGLAFA